MESGAGEMAQVAKNVCCSIRKTGVWTAAPTSGPAQMLLALTPRALLASRGTQIHICTYTHIGTHIY